MEDKPKNKIKTDAKGLSCLQCIAIVIIVTFMISFIIGIGLTLGILYMEWQRAEFVEHEQAVVQHSIQEICSIDDYVANAHNFDTSSGFPPRYYDRSEDGESLISCHKYEEAWDVTATMGIR